MSPFINQKQEALDDSEDSKDSKDSKVKKNLIFSFDPKDHEDSKEGENDSSEFYDNQSSELKHSDKYGDELSKNFDSNDQISIPEISKVKDEDSLNSNSNKQENEELRALILQNSKPLKFNLKSLANKIQRSNSEIDKEHQSFEDL